MQIVEIAYPHGTSADAKERQLRNIATAGVLFFYKSLMAVSFSVLNLKGYEKNDASENSDSKHNVKSFHGYSSLSFGVRKYANSIKTTNTMANSIPLANGILPANIPPIAPAVSVYLAASANIFAITFLLSLFTIKVYLKEGLNARG
jgi:hypothetical protein